MVAIRVVGCSSVLASEVTVGSDLSEDQKIHATSCARSGRRANVSAAHDLCNHLQVVCSALNIIQRSFASGSGQAMDIVFSGARSSLERASRLGRTLVDAGAKDEDAVEPVSLAARLADLRNTIFVAAGPDINVELTVADDVPHVHCAPAALDDVVLNLVVNAVRAMPLGGRLSVAAVRGSRSPEPLPYAELRVADTGCGMSAEVAARAFEPRFTTRSSGSGSGIGLAMVAEFAREVGGSVDLATRQHVGTVVTIHIPGLLKTVGDSTKA